MPSKKSTTHKINIEGATTGGGESGVRRIGGGEDTRGLSHPWKTRHWGPFIAEVGGPLFETTKRGNGSMMAWKDVCLERKKESRDQNHKKNSPILLHNKKYSKCD